MSNLFEQDATPPEPSYRTISLTQGQVTLVDADDYDYLIQWDWHALWSPKLQKFYACRNDRTYMHRLILSCEGGDYCDHKNRNTLDNRRDNLRKCTQAQNCANGVRHRDNKSGFKGVHWDNYTGRWKAEICCRGVRKNLGRFNSAKEAAAAYDEAAQALFGEFARLNL
jgi:hypothetical protein